MPLENDANLLHARLSNEVLRVLAEGAGKVVTHEEIVGAVWGAHRAARLHHLRVAIGELRRKLEADPAHPRHILTEIGVGYRLAVRNATSTITKLRPTGQ